MGTGELTSPHAKQGYLVELDAIRAFAVVAVLLYHVFPLTFPYGYLGVDIFFVVSGFIITRRYYPALMDGSVSLWDFFLGRVRRLGPALLVVLLITTAVAMVLLDAPALREYGATLVAQPFYAQNFVFWGQGDYFRGVYTRPSLHTWSLAVEEQFYLLFGLLVCWGRRRPRLLAWLLGVGALGSLALGFWLVNRSPSTAFYWLPTRLWQLALGIACARLTVRWTGPVSPVFRRVVPALALGVSIAGVFFANDTPTRFLSFREIGVCGGVALALFAIGQPGPGAFGLGARPLHAVGRLSYALYLVHWPLIAFWRLTLERPFTTMEGVGAVVGSGVLAVLLHRGVELPVRRGLRFPGVRRLLWANGLASLMVMGLGVGFMWTDGGLPFYEPAVAKLYRASMGETAWRCPMYRLLNPNAEICPLGPQAGVRPVLVLGDSLAIQVKDVLRELGASAGRSLLLSTRSGCDLGRYGERPYCSLGVLEEIVRQARLAKVVDVVVLSFWRPRRTPTQQLVAQGALFTAAGMNLWLVEAPPMDRRLDPLRRVERYRREGVLVREGVGRARHDRRRGRERALLDSAASALGPKANVVWVTELFCDAEVCPFYAGDTPLYRDARHLTPAGAERLRPVLSQVMRGERH